MSHDHSIYSFFSPISTSSSSTPTSAASAELNRSTQHSELSVRSEKKSHPATQRRKSRSKSIDPRQRQLNFPKVEVIDVDAMSETSSSNSSATSSSPFSAAASVVSASPTLRTVGFHEYFRQAQAVSATSEQLKILCAQAYRDAAPNRLNRVSLARLLNTHTPKLSSKIEVPLELPANLWRHLDLSDVRFSEELTLSWNTQDRYGVMPALPAAWQQGTASLKFSPEHTSLEKVVQAFFTFQELHRIFERPRGTSTVFDMQAFWNFLTHRGYQTHTLDFMPDFRVVPDITAFPEVDFTAGIRLRTASAAYEFHPARMTLQQALETILSHPGLRQCFQQERQFKHNSRKNGSYVIMSEVLKFLERLHFDVNLHSISLRACDRIDWRNVNLAGARLSGSVRDHLFPEAAEAIEGLDLTAADRYTLSTMQGMQVHVRKGLIVLPAWVFEVSDARIGALSGARSFRASSVWSEDISMASSEDVGSMSSALVAVRSSQSSSEERLAAFAYHASNDQSVENVVLLPSDSKKEAEDSEACIEGEPEQKRRRILIGSNYFNSPTKPQRVPYAPSPETAENDPESIQQKR